MPDEKIVRLFISHSWDHDEDYIGLIRILRKIDQFDFYNYSVPEQDPLEADSDKELMQELCDQLRGCHVLLVIGSMYLCLELFLEGKNVFLLSSESIPIN
ncbi:MAG: TIR domain-containing protein [Candidatus Heimdallarchaeota archaeon]